MSLFVCGRRAKEKTISLTIDSLGILNFVEMFLENLVFVIDIQLF